MFGRVAGNELEAIAHINVADLRQLGDFHDLGIDLVGQRARHARRPEQLLQPRHVKAGKAGLGHGRQADGHARHRDLVRAGAGQCPQLAATGIVDAGDRGIEQQLHFP